MKYPKGWFRIGRELTGPQAAVLTVCSFLLPIGIWCFLAYAPFLWKVDYRITLTAQPEDRVAFGAVYAAGDEMDSEYFERFRQAVREDNKRLAAVHAEGGEFEMSERSARRFNRGLLQDFEPILARLGRFNPGLKDQLETRDYYEALYTATYRTWGDIARGELDPDQDILSEENQELIAENWALLAEVNQEFDANDFLSEPLYKLVPEGDKLIGRPSYLPAPHEVIETAWRDFRGESTLGDLRLWEKYGQSLKIVFGGFALAALIGLPLALMAGTFGFFSKLIEPFTDFFRYMPAPAFSTVLVAICGLAEAPKIALVVMGTLPHLILVVANTTRTTDRALLDAAQTLGARRGQLLSRVVIPAILPQLYNDLRILLGWAWTWLVIAELIGMKSGLTEIIDNQGRRFQFEHVYPVIFLIGITGFVTDQILAGLRSLLFPWTITGKPGLIARLFLLPKRFGSWLTNERVMGSA